MNVKPVSTHTDSFSNAQFHWKDYLIPSTNAQKNVLIWFRLYKGLVDIKMTTNIQIKLPRNHRTQRTQEPGNSWDKRICKTNIITLFELSLLVSPFRAPLIAPCGCGFRLACDQACVRQCQASAREQPNQDLVSGGGIDGAGVALGAGAGEDIFA